MAGYQMNSFYRPSPLTVDTHAHKYFDDEDSEILDENILEHGALDSALDMSPPMAGSRRDSYAVSSAMFSPKTEDWQHADMHAAAASTHPFAEHHGNPFANPAHPAPGFAQQSQGWMASSSGACTPMQQQQPYDGLPADFEPAASLSYRPVHAQTPFSNAGNQVSLFSPSNTSNGSMPTSPQKDWLESIEHRAMPKRMRVGSPGLRSHSPLLRRDGIRKKNARFDIPAERNLLNIDQLIAQSNDDQEIKELKQQKRLLRNRQAALDSRQRKKQHTERLEDEKKHYTALLNDLEEELAEAKISLDDWTHKEQQYQQYIENLQAEKEEMLRAHTLETGDLRKKVSVLTEHVQKMESHAMAPVPSTSAFAADYADIESLTMDGAWDSISFLNDFPSEDVKAEAAPVPAKKNEVTLVSEEKPVAQGLLCMLLMFGAYIASTGTSASIPRMSDDVRAASTSLLQDMYKDAGVAQTASGVIEAMAPLPSGGAWSVSGPTHVRPNDMSSFGPSNLGSFADALSQPTEQQKNEQLFGLSAAQYHGVSSPDYMRGAPVPSTSPGRRNLADTLAAMRSNSKQSAAEVYTRSLLWDQVPRDVVRNFAQMVSEHSRSDQDSGDAVG